MSYTRKRGEHAGETFSSYYAYRNEVAREAGYSNYYGQTHGEVPYNDQIGWIIDRYADTYGLERGEVVRNSEFAEKYNAAKEAGFSTEAHGAFAEFLEFAGVREEGADYCVGCTP